MTARAWRTRLEKRPARGHIHGPWVAYRVEACQWEVVQCSRCHDPLSGWIVTDETCHRGDTTPLEWVERVYGRWARRHPDVRRINTAMRRRHRRAARHA